MLEENDNLEPETRRYLLAQLIKLGDLMGDGLHHESDGKWISREYKKTLKALGMAPKRKNNSETINRLMTQRVTSEKCCKCEGALRQTRSGSKRARCIVCNTTWQLLK